MRRSDAQYIDSQNCQTCHTHWRSFTYALDKHFELQYTVKTITAFTHQKDMQRCNKCCYDYSRHHTSRQKCQVNRRMRYLSCKITSRDFTARFFRRLFGTPGVDGAGVGEATDAITTRSHTKHSKYIFYSLFKLWYRSKTMEDEDYQVLHYSSRSWVIEALIEARNKVPEVCILTVFDLAVSQHYITCFVVCIKYKASWKIIFRQDSEYKSWSGWRRGEGWNAIPHSCIFARALSKRTLIE